MTDLQIEFLDNVNKNGKSFKNLGKCYLWVKKLTPKGYGKFKKRLASTWSYELFIGKIPKGLQVDHLCRVRHCVNPNHLEAVTPKENTRRGRTGEALRIRNLAKTHCANGHLYSEKNTYRDPVRLARQCNICRRKRGIEYRERKRNGQ